MAQTSRQNNAVSARGAANNLFSNIVIGAYLKHLRELVLMPVCLNGSAFETFLECVAGVGSDGDKSNSSARATSAAR